MRSLLTAVLVLPACAFVVPKFYSQQLRSTLITTQAVDAELVPTAPELVPTAPTKVEPAPDASAEEKADFIASLAEDDEVEWLVNKRLDLNSTCLPFVSLCFVSGTD